MTQQEKQIKLAEEVNYPRMDETADGWWWLFITNAANDGQWCPSRVEYLAPKRGRGPSLKVAYMRPDGPVGTVILTEINHSDWGGRINPPNV